jgi:hypothetical protein
MQRAWAHDAGAEDERPDAVVPAFLDVPSVLPVASPARARGRTAGVPG